MERRGDRGGDALLGPGRGLAAEYTIGPDDVLDIAVWNNTAISRTVPVRPDGKISLPLVNDVQAAGLTPMQLKDVVTKKLSKYMSTPEVSVIVREVHCIRGRGAMRRPVPVGPGWAGTSEKGLYVA